MTAFLALLLTFCEIQCQVTCAVTTQELCDACIEQCESERLRRVAPFGPRSDPSVDYRLHRTIGLTALNYMNPEFPGWLETAREIHDFGFNTAQLWIDVPPYCPGHWEPPYPSNTWITDEYGCEMEWLIAHGPINQLFLLPTAWAKWDGDYMEDNAPLYFLTLRMYEMAWWRDLTVVFVHWEQDYQLDEISVEEFIERESEHQRRVNLARELALRRYPLANLNVLHAIVLNRYPGYNINEGEPTVAEAVGEMVKDPTLHEPDLLGISYWKRGLDPIPALEWVKETTGYPKRRMFIAEFGARADEQPQRYEEYIPLFWDWGIKTVLIWVHDDTWDEKYTPTAEGMETLQRLNIEAIDWRNRGTINE